MAAHVHTEGDGDGAQWSRAATDASVSRVRGGVRTAVSRIAVVLVGLIVATTRVAAQTSASDLQLIQFLVRLQNLARNVAYLLGPALVLVGAILYLFTTRNRHRSARGKRMLYGGVGLFAIGLALDVLLNAIAWIVTA
jgi:hypothetical protein